MPEERERACDEAALRTRCRLGAYADTIPRVCRLCAECHCPVAAVTDADLKKNESRKSWRIVRCTDRLSEGNCWRGPLCSRWLCLWLSAWLIFLRYARNRRRIRDLKWRR